MTAVDFKLPFNILTYNDSEYILMLRKKFRKDCQKWKIKKKLQNVLQQFYGLN